MAFKPKTYLDLCMAMKTRAIVSLGGGKNPDFDTTGTINAIAAEDGSGYCWNVTVQPEGTVGMGMGAGLLDPITVFFREG